MIRTLLAAAAICLSLGSPSLAQDRVTLGWGRLFSNDALGDTRDRWRTGSYVVSMVRGDAWQGSLPPTIGELLEFRMRAEIIAPADLVSPVATDRRYVGALSLGAHTHFDMSGFETSLGVDLVMTGPQTGVGKFQKAVHKLIDLPEPQVLGNQIANGLHPTLVAEIGRSFSLGTAGTVRPFAEAQIGAETMVRAGGDIVLGNFSTGALMLRDSGTGQRYRAIAGDRVQGVSVVLGADMAHVFDSAYLPGPGAATLSDTRSRLRAGMHWQGEKSDVFYGLTWLGKEFEQQPEGQLVGSLNLRLKF
jgi:hypothetical protein